ncbi:MAG: CvpA family protein [Planctomycetes bacterium]|nr:CvpA family protein [Planctomycetota bacterium]MCC7169851.1 CvpA family protein [Planctomycetota bacterium]
MTTALLLVAESTLALPRLDQLTGVDWCAIVIVAWFVVLGIARGFVRELLRLCAWIGGLWLGRRYEGDLAPHLRESMNGLQPPLDSVVAYFLIVGAVLIVCWFVLRLFQKGLKRLQLQSYDRLFGAVIGATKGLLLVAFAVLALSHLPGFGSAKAAVKKSEAARFTEALVKHVEPLFPASVREDFRAFLEPGSATIPSPPSETK